MSYRNVMHHFDDLTTTQKNDYARIANLLLRQSFICKDRDRDRKDYFIAVQFLDLYKNYFSLIDMEVIHDIPNNVIALKSNQGMTHLTLRKNETIVLIVLRKLYYEKQKEVSIMSEILVTPEEIMGELDATGLFEKRIGKTELTDILRKLIRYSLCDAMGDVRSLEHPLMLYPSLLHVLSIRNIEELQNIITSYGKGEIDNEATDEN